MKISFVGLTVGAGVGGLRRAVDRGRSFRACVGSSIRRMSQDWYRTALQHPAPQVREHRPDSPADSAPQRFDMYLPANQRKLEVVEELGRLAGTPVSA